MYVRLAFAVAVHVDPDILLVDEVLAVGDEPFQRKCMDRIRTFQDEGRTIILVTHSLDQVADVCDRAVVLERGRIKADDVPAKALRVLRSDFDHIRAEELSRANVEHGDEPEPLAAVTGIELLASGRPVSTIRPGDPLTVRLTVSARQPIERWILGFGFDAANGQVIYGTNSKLMGQELDAISGVGRFDFTIPQTFLGEGRYTVHGAVADGAGAELHRLREAAQVVVAADGSEVGFVTMRPTLSRARGHAGVSPAVPAG
jgi:ABC-2 type transport system ATP-binding protein